MTRLPRPDTPDLSKYAPLAKTFIGSFTASLLVLVQPALALGPTPLQASNVCETEIGSFIEAMAGSAGTIAVAAIVIAIFLGAGGKPFARSGHQASAMNKLLSGAFAGLGILIIAIPILSWGLEFTPFAPSLSCLPFIG